MHRRAKRDLEARTLSLQSFLRKGVSLGHGGKDQNLEDLKDADGPVPVRGGGAAISYKRSPPGPVLSEDTALPSASCVSV